MIDILILQKNTKISLPYFNGGKRNGNCR